MSKEAEVIIMIVGGLIYCGVFGIHNFGKSKTVRGEATKTLLPFSLPLKYFFGYLLAASVLLFGFGSYNGYL